MANPFHHFSQTRLYTLRKCRSILKSSYSLFLQKKSRLDPTLRDHIETVLIELDDAILANDREKADQTARTVEALTQQHLPKSFLTHLREFTTAILIAFFIAIVIRQVWFEPYQIPSGSMRPTFKEQDHLTVSKTAFGLNFPFKTSHLYFDPSLVQRSSVLIFSADGIEHIDGISRYFWIFPYKKRVIKRLIGKPGDSLYFYGGRIYGVDKEGNDLKELREEPGISDLEYIPFMNMDGKRIVRPPKQDGLTTQILFYQMNQPIGRILLGPHQGWVGQIRNGSQWITENTGPYDTLQKKPQAYSDFWGMRNFATTRLLSKKEVEKHTDLSLDGVDEGLLYLELRHNPRLTYPQPKLTPVGIYLSPFRSIIPLKEHHIKAIMDNMYTARFVIKEGKATRYTMLDTGCGTTPLSAQPDFPDVPDGIYEFYHGKAVQVGRFGITTPLPANHPLYSTDPKHVQKLYNMGIEFCKTGMPQDNQYEFPNRYGYFRNGDLHLLGGPVILKEDPVLVNFHVREKHRQETASALAPYIPFKDHAPPLKENGEIDVEFIRAFGLEVPAKSYFVLGDNHAMSGDSRLFGFLPEENIQGAPTFIIWPPENMGLPNHKPYPLLTFPRLLVWSIAAFAGVGYFIYHRRRRGEPVIPRNKQKKEKK